MADLTTGHLFDHMNIIVQVLNWGKQDCRRCFSKKKQNITSLELCDSPFLANTKVTLPSHYN